MSASTSGSNSSTSSAESVARSAKAAFDAAQLLEDGASERVRALQLVREALQSSKQEILAANAQDMDVRRCPPPCFAGTWAETHLGDTKAARKQVEAGTMSTSLLKRLDLQSSPSKYDDMLQGVADVANLPDPAGQTTYASKLDEGLTLHRVTCASPIHPTDICSSTEGMSLALQAQSEFFWSYSKLVRKL